MSDTNIQQRAADKQPTIIPAEIYTSPEYALAERKKLWPKVWQIACRAEEIQKVGDYVTYDILDESIIVVRNATDRIQAFYNVCQHRGRRLTSGCGHTAQFHCRFHGWRWQLNGENAFVLDKEDWGAALCPDILRLKQVKCDVWGGWVWINMDPECEPLLEFLGEVSSRLEPFELDKMRFRWRQWLYFPCNWKVAIGAFIESYHLDATHPQLLRGGPGFRSWSRALGRHGHQGGAGLRGDDNKGKFGAQSPRGRTDRDARIAVAEEMALTWEGLNAMTTETFVNASRRLVDELPAGLTLAEAWAHLVASAKQDDADRGVIWPELEPAFVAENSCIWHLFPNSVIINTLTTALCYRVRPNGDNPDSCIFEVYVIERFPEGHAPETEWEFKPEPTEENWRKVLAQDFQNMSEVQRGMKSQGFSGARPNPISEGLVANFFRNLVDCVGSEYPRTVNQVAASTIPSVQA